MRGVNEPPFCRTAYVVGLAAIEPPVKGLSADNRQVCKGFADTAKGISPGKSVAKNSLLNTGFRHKCRAISGWVRHIRDSPNHPAGAAPQPEIEDYTTKKYTRYLAAFAAVITVTLADPAMAQTSDQGGAAGGGSDTTATTTSANNQQGDNGTDWGWMSLAGLLGLRRPAPTVVHQKTDGNAKAY